MSIAARFGCDVTMLYNLPGNGHLKTDRPDATLLHPGDIVFVPDSIRSGLLIAAGQYGHFKGRIPHTMVRIQIRDVNGILLRNCTCTLTFEERTLRATTDGEGVVEWDVPATLELADLAVWPETPGEEDIIAPERWGAFLLRLEIGHMNPVSDRRGVRQRLENLGFAEGGAPFADIGAAICAFQRAWGLPESGTMDDDTGARLLEVHDGARR